MELGAQCQSLQWKVDGIKCWYGNTFNLPEMLLLLSPAVSLSQERTPEGNCVWCILLLGKAFCHTYTVKSIQSMQFFFQTFTEVGGIVIAKINTNPQNFQHANDNGHKMDLVFQQARTLIPHKK